MNGDLISRSKLLHEFSYSEDGTRYPEHDCDNFPADLHLTDVKRIIREAPAEDAKVVRHGRWARIKDDYSHLYEGQCTKCGCEPLNTPFHRPFNYCPNCGAEMDQQEEEA